MRGSEALLVKDSLISTFPPYGEVVSGILSNSTTLDGPGAGVGLGTTVGAGVVGAGTGAGALPP